MINEDRHIRQTVMKPVKNTERREDMDCGLFQIVWTGRITF